MIGEGIVIKGQVVIDVFERGRHVERIVVPNLVVDAGLNHIRDLLRGATTAAIQKLAVGTGTTAPAAGQTALVSEVFRNTLVGIVASAKRLVAQYYLSSSEANGYTLTEAGLFTATNVMVARVVHSPIAKTSLVSVSYNWTLDLSAITS